MQPYLNTKREQIKKKRKIEYNLNSLKRDHRNITFSTEDLYHMAEQCVIADAIDKRIAACIIAVNCDENSFKSTFGLLTFCDLNCTKIGSLDYDIGSFVVFIIS